MTYIFKVQTEAFLILRDFAKVIKSVSSMPDPFGLGEPSMTDDAKRLSVAAQNLAPSDRLELVERLLDSLDAPDNAVDQLWTTEAESRLAAYRRGDIQAVPLASVLAKYAAS